MGDDNFGKQCEFITVDIPQQSDDLNFIENTSGGEKEEQTKKANGFMQFLTANELISTEDEEEDDLNAPLLEELDINVKEILYKIRCALFPFKINRDVLIENPDFWGPMFVVLLYGFLVVWGQFEALSWVFTIWLFGSFITFILGRALGGNIFFSQTVGMIGYSVIPIVVVSILLYFITNNYLQWILKGIAAVWATYSAGSSLCTPEIQNKKILLMYPIFLLFVYLMGLYSGV